MWNLHRFPQSFFGLPHKRGVTTPQGKQNGHYGHVGVRPPPPLRGSSPCEAGLFIPADFDCRHSEVCKSRNSVSLSSLNSFFQMVLNPQECGAVPPNLLQILSTQNNPFFSNPQDVSNVTTKERGKGKRSEILCVP